MGIGPHKLCGCCPTQDMCTMDIDRIFSSSYHLFKKYKAKNDCLDIEISKLSKVKLGWHF